MLNRSTIAMSDLWHLVIALLLSCLLVIAPMAFGRDTGPYSSDFMEHLHQKAKEQPDPFLISMVYLFRPLIEPKRLAARSELNHQLMIGKGKSLFAEKSGFRRTLATINQLSQSDALDPVTIARLFGVNENKKRIVSDSATAGSFEVVNFLRADSPTAKNCASRSMSNAYSDVRHGADMLREPDGSGGLRLIRNVSNDRAVEMLVVPIEYEQFSKDQLEDARSFAAFATSPLVSSYSNIMEKMSFPTAESLLYREELNRFLLSQGAWQIGLRKEGKLFLPTYTNYSNHGYMRHNRGSYFYFNAENYGEYATPTYLTAQDGLKNPLRLDARYIWTTYQQLEKANALSDWRVYLQFRKGSNVHPKQLHCTELVLERRAKSPIEKDLGGSKVTTNGPKAPLNQRESLIGELFMPRVFIKRTWELLTDPSIETRRRLYRLRTSDDMMVVAQVMPKCKVTRRVRMDSGYDAEGCELIYQYEYQVNFKLASESSCFPTSSLVRQLRKHGLIESDGDRWLFFSDPSKGRFKIRSESDLNAQQITFISPYVIPEQTNEYPDATILSVASAYLGFQLELIDKKSAKKMHEVFIKSFGQCVASIRIVQV
jgi:hypothetical protein